MVFGSCKRRRSLFVRSLKTSHQTCIKPLSVHFDRKTRIICKAFFSINSKLKPPTYFSLHSIIMFHIFWPKSNSKAKTSRRNFLKLILKIKKLLYPKPVNNFCGRLKLPGVFLETKVFQ